MINRYINHLSSFNFASVVPQRHAITTVQKQLVTGRRVRLASRLAKLRRKIYAKTGGFLPAGEASESIVARVNVEFGLFVSETALAQAQGLGSVAYVSVCL